MSGTYVFVTDVARAATIDVGALGDREFPAGAYAYVGSAFGPGGFTRVDRHRSKAPTRSHSLRSRDTPLAYRLPTRAPGREPRDRDHVSGRRQGVRTSGVAGRRASPGVRCLGL